MSIHKVKVQRTAHLHVLGAPGKHVTRFCIACHGYGESAAKFVQKFSDLIDDETLVVAPEGLSKFYFEGFTGKVGASWMTSEHREQEIEDYLNYLQRIYDLFVPQLAEQVQISFFGFSQGGVTLTRFAMLRKPIFHNLVIWANNFAHDIDFKKGKEFLSDKKVYLVIGDEDQFVTPDRIEMNRKFAKEQGIAYTQIGFKGNHRVDRKVLADLFDSF